MIKRDKELLRFAKASRASQDEFELYQLLRVVNDIRPKVICEIGVHLGGGMETFKKAFPNADVFGIDDGNWPEPDDKQIIPDNCKLFVGDSTSKSMTDGIKEYLNGRKIDFLFIDGDHTYEGCRNDYENYSQFVREGGVIGFHDINKRGFDFIQVSEFTKELDDYGFNNIEIRASQNSPGVKVLYND